MKAQYYIKQDNSYYGQEGYSQFFTDFREKAEIFNNKREIMAFFSDERNDSFLEGLELTIEEVFVF